MSGRKSKAPPAEEAAPAAPPDLLSMSRLERLRWLVREQQTAYQRASSSGSHVAAGAALREMERLLKSLEEEEATQKQQATDTEAQVFAALQDAAATIATPHLEVFVREWQQRHPGIRILRQGAMCPHCKRAP